MKVKLGQVLKFTKDHTVELSNGGSAVIKVGDTAQVLRKVDALNGEILYLTGKAKGLSQIIALEVDDSLDIDSITEKILRQLNE
ncbi:MAG: hypothetical protein Q8930_03540 [Bacillota bacterium]|nr:hypothetical protein [Bacillota bacterium]